MGHFELTLSTDNAAFEGYAGEQEVARILRDAAVAMESGSWTPGQPTRIVDTNGNRVGFWQWAAG